MRLSLSEPSDPFSSLAQKPTLEKKGTLSIEAGVAVRR
jgi:hypothetical protein